MRYVKDFVNPLRCDKCHDILDGIIYIPTENSKLGLAGEYICKKCFQSSKESVNDGNVE